MERQVLAIKHYIEGNFNLPSKEQMLKSYHEDVENSINKDPAYLFKPKPVEGWKMIDQFYSHINHSPYKGKNEKFYTHLKLIMKTFGEHLMHGNFRSFKYTDY